MLRTPPQLLSLKAECHKFADLLACISVVSVRLELCLCLRFFARINGFCLRLRLCLCARAPVLVLLWREPVPVHVLLYLCLCFCISVPSPVISVCDCVSACVCAFVSARVSLPVLMLSVVTVSLRCSGAVPAVCVDL